MFFEVKPRLPGDKTSPANIVGCDYSAAMKQPNATWIARGRLESSILYIDSLENVGSDRLVDNLLGLENLLGPNNSSVNRPLCHQDELAKAECSGLSDWIIGLDFPFSFPAPFAKILLGTNPAYSSQTASNSPSWVDLATLVSGLPFEELLAQVQIAKPIMGGEVKRLTDNCTDPKAQSPLHQINPGMLKMTWQGMQLLLALHKEGFAILPFATTAGISLSSPASNLPIRQNPNSSGRAGSTQCCDNQRAENPGKGAPHFRPAVMEVYPAAVLKSLCQPWRKYKGKDPEAKQLRQLILNNLSGRSNLTSHNSLRGNNNLAGQSDKLRSVNRIATALPELSLPPNLEQFALASDDALDAVIAALGAAIAYLNPSQTAPPRQISTDLIALEGWIYVPHPKTIEATPEVMA